MFVCVCVFVNLFLQTSWRDRLVAVVEEEVEEIAAAATDKGNKRTCHVSKYLDYPKIRTHLRSRQ